MCSHSRPHQKIGFHCLHEDVSKNVFSENTLKSAFVFIENNNENNNVFLQFHANRIPKQISLKMQLKTKLSVKLTCSNIILGMHYESTKMSRLFKLETCIQHKSKTKVAKFITLITKAGVWDVGLAAS